MIGSGFGIVFKLFVQQRMEKMAEIQNAQSDKILGMLKGDDDDDGNGDGDGDGNFDEIEVEVLDENGNGTGEMVKQKVPKLDTEDDIDLSTKEGQAEFQRKSSLGNMRDEVSKLHNKVRSKGMRARTVVACFQC
jgi:hypothetical protein